MATARQLIATALKAEDPDFRHAYAESFLNSRIALQIRSNRKARGWTQKQLADKAGKRQSQISALEKIDNESWKISTLLKVADAFDLVLIVKFESFGDALEDFASTAPEELVRPSFDDDPVFRVPSAPEETRFARSLPAESTATISASPSPLDYLQLSHEVSIVGAAGTPQQFLQEEVTRG